MFSATRVELHDWPREGPRQQERHDRTDDQGKQNQPTQATILKPLRPDSVRWYDEYRVHPIVGADQLRERACRPQVRTVAAISRSPRVLVAETFKRDADDLGKAPSHKVPALIVHDVEELFGRAWQIAQPVG